MSNKRRKNEQKYDSDFKMKYRLIRYQKIKKDHTIRQSLFVIIFPISIIIIFGGTMVYFAGNNAPVHNPGGDGGGDGGGDDGGDEPYESDITFTTIYGGLIKLADHQGQVVIVYFFGLHCPGCPGQTDILGDIDNVYSSSELYIVPVCLESVAQSSNDALQSYLSARQSSWPAIRDNTISYPYASYFDISVEPTVKILDKNGNIVATMIGQDQGSFNNIKTKVDSLL